MNITVKTKYPVAFDSPDHIKPWGTKRDNTTNHAFIDEMHSHFKSTEDLDTFNFLDLGCSGGQLVVDFAKRGNLSVGLEGSDYSVIHGRANWPEYYNKNLFTCDVTKPYLVYNEGNQVFFNLITAWEVVEHIHPGDLGRFFLFISDNLLPGGIFLASISTKHDNVEGVELHQSVFSREEWNETKFNEVLMGLPLELHDYPFEHKVRSDASSFHIMLKRI